jgi:hypothetical protein
MNQLTRPRLVAHALRDPMAAIYARLEDLPHHYCEATRKLLRTATTPDYALNVAEWAKDAAAYQETFINGDREAANLRLLARLLEEAAPIIEAQRKETRHHVE